MLNPKMSYLQYLKVNSKNIDQFLHFFVVSVSFCHGNFADLI